MDNTELPVYDEHPYITELTEDNIYQYNLTLPLPQSQYDGDLSVIHYSTEIERKLIGLYLLKYVLRHNHHWVWRLSGNKVTSQNYPLFDDWYTAYINDPEAKADIVYADDGFFKVTVFNREGLIIEDVYSPDTGFSLIDIFMSANATTIDGATLP